MFLWSGFFAYFKKYRIRYIIERKVNLKEKISMKNKTKLAQRFEGFDYEAYWEKWEKEHPGQSKEIDWGEPVGREFKW